MRKIIIAGNWKLNNTIQQSLELTALLKRELADVKDVGIVVCPVFTALSEVSDVLYETNIELGAQDLYWEDAGAFTGEVSAPLLKEIGVAYVIIGHSERRQFFGESNETVNKKIKAALAHGLTPIVCVGETLQEREKGQTESVIKLQCEQSLKDLSKEEIKKAVIAYEPVWAIGTGKTATPQQAQDVHRFIRSLLMVLFDEETALSITIQYGGSVKPENTSELIAQPDIDGALVGGASLKADSFVNIVRNACGVKAHITQDQE